MDLLRALLNDEQGFVVSAELVLVASVAVLSLVVGLSEVAVAINTELNDLSNAFGALNQSYHYAGFLSRDCDKFKSSVAGSSYYDGVDDCDRNQSCDIVANGSMIAGEGGHR